MPKSNYVKILTFLALLILEQACTGLKTATQHDVSPSRSLPLDQVERLRIGISNSKEAISSFGAPDMRPVVEDLESKDVWIYLTEDQRSTRLSLIFNPGTGILESINWFVEPGEQEADLNFVSDRYPGRKFKRYDAEWTHPHSAPDRSYLMDKKTGFKIVYSKTSGQVESLTWSSPSKRTIANH